MVDTQSRFVTAVGLAISVLLLTACQFSEKLRQGDLDNTHFMDVWSIYTHCVTSLDLESTQQDSFRLRTISKTGAGLTKFESSLSNLQTTTRLAVDPNAMSASCTLHAGNIAAMSGRNDIAREMFNTVVREHTHSIYDYYAQQARTRLIELGA
jgi:hypothetical protein